MDVWNILCTYNVQLYKYTPMHVYYPEKRIILLEIIPTTYKFEPHISNTQISSKLKFSVNRPLKWLSSMITIRFQN